MGNIDKIREIIENSKKEAVVLKSNFIGPGHIIIAILRDEKSNANEIIRRLNINPQELIKSLEISIKEDPIFKNEKEVDKISLTKESEEIFRNVKIEAENLDSKIDSEHVLLSIIRFDNIISRSFLKIGIDYGKIKQTILNMMETNENTNPTSGPEKNPKNKSTNMLDHFSRDLTKLAKEGKLDPVVGRVKELKRVAQILTRRRKNNPILLGEPGCGKTSIAEALAQHIVQKKCPRVLFNKRIVSLDLGLMVAGTKYRGEFEERMKNVLKELENQPDIIVFLDEIHTLVGAGGASGSLDAANMIKPALSRGEIQVIGSTTLDEYRKHIEKDGALERRFQKIIILPPTDVETVEILKNIKDRYEDHHMVKYTPEALEACVSLTARYITDRCQPDKSIDALDEAGAHSRIENDDQPKAVIAMEKMIDEMVSKKSESIANQKYEEAASYRDEERKLTEQLRIEKEKWMKTAGRKTVTESDIKKVVSLISGIPVDEVTADENQKLKNMKPVLESKIIGQNEAVDKVVKAIRRNRIGLKDPKKPIGVFMLLGPTGVGKSLLAKLLAKELFGSENALIRIDMSEYMEKHSTSKLIGAAPGYVGYEEGGQLTEKVRRKPYSVILLDEIEKAHPETFNAFLQVFDDGILTDSAGKKVDFKNTIILMTSNIGSRKVKDFGAGIGFNNSSKSSNNNPEKIVLEELKKHFAPEFLNRVDDVITFNSLEKEQIREITDLEINYVVERIVATGYKVKITKKVRDFIAEEGFDSAFGARPLKRAIQKNIEDVLAEEIIENENLSKLDTIKLDLVDGKVKTIVSKKKVKETEKTCIDLKSVVEKKNEKI